MVAGTSPQPFLLLSLFSLVGLYDGSGSGCRLPRVNRQVPVPPQFSSSSVFRKQLHMQTLKCFVVTQERKADQPLFVAVDLDVKRSFERAKSFVLGYNSIHQTGRTVIRRGNARLTWNQQTSIRIRSVGS